LKRKKRRSLNNKKKVSIENIKEEE
jgi:hypothetical protein